MSGETLFAAIGSPHGDDAIAWLIADALLEGCPEEMRILKLGAPTDLLNHSLDVARLILCDACHGSGDAGTVTLWTWPNLPALLARQPGTHSFGTADVLKLCENLRQLPPVVQILGIEVSNCGRFGALSPVVQQRWPEIVRTVRETISRSNG